MVVILTNRSNRTLEASLDIEFLRGSLVDGSNITTPWDPLRPGQSEQETADIDPSSGAGHPGDKCFVQDMNIYVPGSSTTLATYYAEGRG